MNMNAAEKLKALEALANGSQTYGPKPLEYEQAAEILMNALPQIRVVVEAAEGVDEYAMKGTRLRYMGTSSTPVEPQKVLDLAAALTALRDSLDGDDVT